MPSTTEQGSVKVRRVLRVIRRIILGTLLGVVLLFLLIVALIQFPAIQNYIKNKVVNALSEKLNTTVRLGYIRINFGGSLVLEDFYLEDRQHDTIINAGKLKVSLNPTGLLRNRLIISNVSLSGTKFNYLVFDSTGKTNLDFIIHSFAGEDKEKTEDKEPMEILIKEVNVATTSVTYSNLADSMLFKLQLGRLNVDISKSDLDSMKFGINRILLENTRVDLISYSLFTKVENEVKTTTAKDTASSPLSLSLGQLRLKNVTFNQYDFFTASGGTYQLGDASIVPQIIDLESQTIDIASIIIKNGKVYFKNAVQTGNVGEAKPAEPKVKEEAWKISVDKGNLQFDKLQLVNIVPPAQGPMNYLSDILLTRVILNFSGALGEDFWQGNINNLEFVDNRTSIKVRLSVNAGSRGNSIRLSPFTIQIGSSHVAGRLEGNFSGNPAGMLPDVNASIVSSKFVVNDLAPYLPPDMTSALGRLPSQLLLTANLESKQQKLKGNGELKTSEGNVVFKGEMQNAGNQPAYEVNVKLVNINAGYFAQNQELGNLSAEVNANGTGFNPDSMNTDFDLVINSIGFKGNIYNKLEVLGNINNGFLNTRVSSPNKIASLTTRIKGRLSEEPEFSINSHIINLDLKAMGLIEDTISLSGIIAAHYAGGKGFMEASTDTLQMVVRTPRDEIKTDSKLKYFASRDSVDARVESNFGDIAYKGNVPLQEIATVMKKYFSQYFSKEIQDSVAGSKGYFKMVANIKDLSVLKDLMAINIAIPQKATLNAELKENRFTSNVDFEKIIYNELEVDNLSLKAAGKDSSFQVDFKTAALHNNVHTLKDIVLESNLHQGLLETRLAFSNAASQKWFDIGFAMEPQNPAKNIVINPPLLLNHSKWDVDPGNKTYFENKNIVFKDVKLTNGEKLISLLSDAQRPEKLAVSFKNLELALLSELMEGDTSYIKGKIDGELMATALFAEPLPVFSARLDISNIIVEQRPLGSLNVNASNTNDKNVADLDVKFGRENMLFTLNGIYGLKPEIPMDLTLNTRNLELASVQPLLKDVISEASGAINASVRARGNFSNPVVNGELGFNKVDAFIEAVQSRFAIDQQTILFKGDRVDFNKFTIKDDDGSSLSINGIVALADLKNLSYDLTINSEDFLAYQGPADNLPGQENKVSLTSDIQIKGQNNTPVVRATVNIDEGSKFFYKITKQASTLTEEGVVEFIGYEQESQEEETENVSIMENLSLTTNLTVDDNTVVTIITDPVRNLGLNMEAGGKFSLTQRPYQSPQLTGRLDISGGDYTISLSGIKRRFQIADSSYIEWYGNISEPEMNLRAFYEVRTTPPSEISGTSENSITLPFLVYMNISGSMADPAFSFKLSLPREYEGINNGTVAAKLQEINSNESELNQKAMTLLLFGSFGFDNLEGIITSGQSGRNVIISNALNQFAAQKLKFVDLHFDLESYDNYGGTTTDNLRTEMEIAASKKLADERLNVELGATVVLQADEQEQQKSFADKISPEFNIEYLLNKPRTLSVRAFRQSEYRGLVEGKVISTGAGLLFQKDFNKLSELFGKKPDEAEAVAENQNPGDEK